MPEMTATVFEEGLSKEPVKYEKVFWICDMYRYGPSDVMRSSFPVVSVVGPWDGKVVMLLRKFATRIQKIQTYRFLACIKMTRPVDMGTEKYGYACERLKAGDEPAYVLRQAIDIVEEEELSAENNLEQSIWKP